MPSEHHRSQSTDDSEVLAALSRHDAGTYHCRSQVAERGQGGRWAGWVGPHGCA